MLFFVNQPEEKMFDRIARIDGDEDKALLLVGDAVRLGSSFWQKRLQDLGVDTVYVAKDALAARKVALSDDCEVVDYDEIVDLLLGGDEKVVSL